MTRSKLGLLGFCVAVLGALAFSVTAAQAEVGAKWLYAEKVSSQLIPFLEAFVGLEKETTIVLHSKIAGLAWLVECNAVSTVNTKLQAEGKISTGKIKLSECITKLNGATSAPCKPNAGGTESGVINSSSGHGLLVLHELPPGDKDDLVKLLPGTGETIMTVEASAECAVGTKIPIIGKLTIKDCEGLALTHLVKHLIEVGPLTELWVISKTAEHVLTVLGSAWAFLSGETHKGLKFSGDPA